MPDVLLFGATGYTGRLTARALARRNVDFAIAGRNRAKLDALAEETSGPEVRVASVEDVGSLVHALEDVRVLITTVGPFVELGWTAVEAALEAGVHYIDSTGEGPFIARLIAQHGDRARDRSVVMAPALGFDEVPADVAATAATEGLHDADLVLTYALPHHGSQGTMRSALGIVTGKGQWIEDGRPRTIRAGEEERWSPMPPPLGPRRALAFPLAEGHLAPLHLELRSLKLFVTTGTLERVALRYGLGPLRTVLGTSYAKAIVEGGLARLPKGPSDEQRRRSYWTILAEARGGNSWRNVAITGTDVYGLTAEFLCAGAVAMTDPGYSKSGVLSPVQAVGLDTLQKELIDQGASIDIYEPA